MSINQDITAIVQRLDVLRGQAAQIGNYDDVQAVYAQLRAAEIDMSAVTSLYGHKLQALRAQPYLRAGLR